MSRVRAGWQPSSVVRAAVLLVVVTALLGSGDLLRATSTQPKGPWRDSTMLIADAVDRVSNFLSLNRPADAVASLVGTDRREPTVAFPPTTLPSPTQNQTDAATPIRRGSPDDPVTVEVIGDQGARTLATALRGVFASQNAADGGGGRVDVRSQAVDGAGITRADLYYWPARLQELVAASPVEVVVVMFDQVDNQPMYTVTGPADFDVGGDSWDQVYRLRVAAMMDFVNNGTRHVIWVDVPPPVDPTQRALVAEVNAMVADVAHSRPWVHVVSAAGTVATKGGSPVDWVRSGDAAAQWCRTPDGGELAVACWDRLATAVVRAYAEAS